MSDPTRGQILPGSLFGDVLTRLARAASIIVEIGTWRGEGSTRCLVNGMTKPGQFLWTIEQDDARAAEARQLYKANSRVKVLQARALDIIDMLPGQIDLLLLDGGIDESYDELVMLMPRSRVIALDDTRDAKNQRAYAHLIKLEWRALADNQTDRNGWAVFEQP